MEWLDTEHVIDLNANEGDEHSFKRLKTKQIVLKDKAENESKEPPCEISSSSAPDEDDMFDVILQDIEGLK